MLLEIVNSGTLVSVGSSIVVCGAVAHGAFWLAIKLQRIEDELSAIKKRLDSLPCEKENPACDRNLKKI